MTDTGRPLLLLTGPRDALAAEIVRTAGARGWRAAPGDPADPGLPALLAAAAAVAHPLAADPAATDRLLEALAAAPRPRLVALSALAVYGRASLPEGATLDETTPLEPDAAQRDAATRALLAAELKIAAAAQRGLQARVLRLAPLAAPDAAPDPGLGLRLGPLVLAPPADRRPPALRLARAAETVLRAAAAPPPARSDTPIPSGEGWLEIVNVFDPRPDTVAERLAREGRRLRAPLPLRPLRAAATAVDVAAAFAPWATRLAPPALRLAELDARFKPVRPSAARMEDRLGMIIADGDGA